MKDNLGSELCSFSKIFYEDGCLIKARNENKNIFVEIIVNDKLKIAEIYYNKDFGDYKKREKISYENYINYLYCASETNIITVVENLIGII